MLLLGYIMTTLSSIYAYIIYPEYNSGWGDEILIEIGQIYYIYIGNETNSCLVESSRHLMSRQCVRLCNM